MANMRMLASTQRMRHRLWCHSIQKMYFVYLQGRHGRRYSIYSFTSKIPTSPVAGPREPRIVSRYLTSSWLCALLVGNWIRGGDRCWTLLLDVGFPSIWHICPNLTSVAQPQPFAHFLESVLSMSKWSTTHQEYFKLSGI